MTLQKEHAEWLSRMYPNQPADVPAAGLVEEAGELMHCLLKRRQVELWGDETRYRGVDWHSKIVDAIGDCAVYLVSLCNATNNDFDELMRFARATLVDTSINPFVGAAKLLSTGVGVMENPKLLVPVLTYASWLLIAAKSLGVDFDEALRVTWAEVRGRTR